MIADIEIEPAIGMTVIKIRSGTMYTIEIVEADHVYLRPYWSGRGSRSTWKTRTHLWRDYRIYLGGCNGAD